jgi:hypothetical protein
VFNAYGIERGIDDLDVANHGSGASRTMTSHHAGSGDGGSLLVNSSFSDYLSSGSVTTKFPGWTVTTAAANVTTSSTYFRGFPGSAENTTGGPSDLSIQFNADDTISQKLTVSGTTLDPSRPYFLSVMLYRHSSATGTVTAADVAAAVDALDGVGASVNGAGQVEITTDRVGEAANTPCGLDQRIVVHAERDAHVSSAGGAERVRGQHGNLLLVEQAHRERLGVEAGRADVDHQEHTCLGPAR